jgi:single stranded DNA-binding protein
MAAGDTSITIIGNLVSDPELRYTPTGQAVATFRVASTPRFMDRTTNEWKDGDSLFLSCNVWRQAAENVAESLQRGMRVIVNGRLRQRSYETREGEKERLRQGQQVNQVRRGQRRRRLRRQRRRQPVRPWWPGRVWWGRRRARQR